MIQLPISRIPYFVDGGKETKTTREVKNISMEIQTSNLLFCQKGRPLYHVKIILYDKVMGITFIHIPLVDIALQEPA